jgi:hypothetical protein
VVLSYARHVYRNLIIASVKTKENVVVPINVSIATPTKPFIKIMPLSSDESFSKSN